MTASLHPTDVLQITIQQCGRTINTLTLSGLATLGDVFRHIRTVASAISGLVTVTLRNRTQGWITHHNIVTSRQSVGSVSTQPTSSSCPMPSLFSINTSRIGA